MAAVYAFDYSDGSTAVVGPSGDVAASAALLQCTRAPQAADVAPADTFAASRRGGAFLELPLVRLGMFARSWSRVFLSAVASARLPCRQRGAQCACGGAVLTVGTCCGHQRSGRHVR